MSRTHEVELPPAVAATRRRAASRGAVLALALTTLLVSALASVALGVRATGWDDVLLGLVGDDTTLGSAAVVTRVPRTVLALLVGAALGLSGAVMQGVTRNPLADPGLLGVTGGAALAVVCGIAFFGLVDPTSYLWVAIGGAAVTAVVVFLLGSLGRGGLTPLSLTLAGAATAAVCSSLVSAVLLPRIDVMNEFRFWQIGGVGGADWSRITQAVPFLVVGTATCLLAARSLDLLSLGDDVAAGLGARVARARVLAGAGSVVLCGAATAVAGPIAFVGLVVPHLCRLVIGTEHRWLLPAAALVGAAALCGADVVGRLIARPSEVDVGIVVALIGAPFFIALVRRTRVRAL